MATAIELLTELETEGRIVIGRDRFITIPEDLKRIAVQGDHDVKTVTFDCPRYWDGRDLSEMKFYINFMRSDGSKEPCIAENVIVDHEDESLIHFDWTITRNVAKVSGVLTILVCAKKTDENGNLVNDWNSELNRDLTISEGMECVETPLSEYPDIITHLLTRMDAVEKETVEVISPVITIKEIDNGHSVTVEDANGSQTFMVLNGERGPVGPQGPPGEDGIDGVSCTHSWDGTVLTVTSASGTTSADLKGEKGEPGQNGADGYTPQKGTDYFTETDKNDMVDRVISALPTWNGGTY